MSFFRGEGLDGAPRVYNQKGALARESIHPSARQRFTARGTEEKLKDEPWPKSFEDALK